MQNTMSIFNDRKEEIEFYFSVMVEIDNDNPNIQMIDNTRFYKIMKSNFLLMLYNLVEACIVSGMMEIYEDLGNNNCSYNQPFSVSDSESLQCEPAIVHIFHICNCRTLHDMPNNMQGSAKPSR